MENFMDSLQTGIYQTFILDDNYQYFLNGIRITLTVAFLALIFGMIIGVILALIRTSHDQQQPGKRKSAILGILNLLARLYLTVIRGTPSMVQLLIMWFVIWASARSSDRNLIICAIMAFSINSGAYITEIIRSGIMSIDKGQMEAGRSLGLTYAKTMRYIIVPQAFKNALPALGNEMITLLKETSIVTVIGLKDLTKGAMIIQGKTYQALIPFFAIAAIYLAMVMLLTWLLSRLERRMRQSDIR
ncbi:MAG: amino acid ABC transporter permease [Eubacteriales bacterium]|nr:amino acid ABC transporter permease [Eubacteriales bacterium]